MSKLIVHLSKSDKIRLEKIINNPKEYTLPSMDEVLEYLSSTDDDEMSEIVMDDLIIQYLEEEGLMFDFC